MSKKHGHIFPVYHHIFFCFSPIFFSFLAAAAIKNEGICSGKICVPKGEEYSALKLKKVQFDVTFTSKAKLNIFLKYFQAERS